MRPDVRDGSPSFWGMLALTALLGCSDPSEPDPDPVVWATLDAGTAATCGVSVEGVGYCWGQQWTAGWGGPHDATLTAPREVRGSRRWSAIEVGDRLACGLTRGGETYCWSSSGPGTTGFPDTVSALGGDPHFASITVGDAHACGLTQAGAAYCWASNYRGQTGTGAALALTSPITRATPVVGDLTFLALRAGPESTCGVVSNGDLFCWGGSEVGGEAVEPRPVQQGFAFGNLAYGGNIGGRGHVCSQDGDGELYCFRYEPHELVPQPTPMSVPLAEAGVLRDLAVGGAWPASLQLHACAAAASGTVSCWGSNAYGQLGDGTFVDRPAPTVVSQLNDVVRVTAGGIHSCAVTRTGAAYCWGANDRGQLGTGASSAMEARPREIAAPRR